MKTHEITGEGGGGGGGWKKNLDFRHAGPTRESPVLLSLDFKNHVKTRGFLSITFVFHGGWIILTCVLLFNAKGVSFWRIQFTNPCEVNCKNKK